MLDMSYHRHLIAADSPRVLGARGKDPYDYAKPILERPDARFLIDSWMELYRQPFQGVTANGIRQEGLYTLAGEGLEAEAIFNAARDLLALLTDDERARMQYPIEAREWRSWYNPEFPMNSHGLRLDYATPPVRAAAMELVRTSMGPEGFAKTEQCRLANLHLGGLYDLQNIMNEWSYHFLLFGSPSLTEPWGWSLYGHHLAVNCFMLADQMVISPLFLGFEPNVFVAGGQEFQSFQEEEQRGLELIRSLTEEQQNRAIIYKRMVDPCMPEGRWNFADERQLGSAFQDNRVIPYEGVAGAEMSATQRDLLLRLVEVYAGYLPLGPREARLEQVRTHLDATYFSWIGSFGADDPFYYRVQSPVLLLEFDHHSGVWLTNAEPQKFHTHVSVRTPNGNDYGRELLRLHLSKQRGQPYQLAESDREPVQDRAKGTASLATPGTRAEHAHTGGEQDEQSAIADK